MLTDSQIKQEISAGNLSINPYNEVSIKAGKYDFHLGPRILKPKNIGEVLDPASGTNNPEYEDIDITDNAYILQPGEFVLGQTIEKVKLGNRISMFVDGSSTLARVGLSIHQTAMFIPAGQDEHIITLEILNSGPWAIKLSNNLRIGKFVIFKYSEDNKIPAKDFNQYNGQSETTGAKFTNRNTT